MRLFAYGVTLNVAMSVCVVQTQPVQLQTSSWQKADMAKELLELHMYCDGESSWDFNISHLFKLLIFPHSLNFC